MTESVMQSAAVSAREIAPFTGPDAGPDGGGNAGAFFATLLDIVNPLQHLPVISTLYRAVTGDTIAAPARLVGGALYGGPVGAASAAVNLAVEDITGADIGDHALALLTGEDTAPADQLASDDGATPAAPRGEPVFVAHGDANAMTPDAVTWNGQWRQPTTASPLHARAGEPAAAKDAARAAETAALDGTAVIPDADAMPDPAVPVRRAWIAAAIADAERNRAAVQAGRNPEPLTSPIPPESLAATMVHALEKYRAMMIARNGGPGGT